MKYKMGLQEKYFNDMKYGTKKIEMRLFDEKRHELKIDDTIYFLLEPDRKKKIETNIVNLTTYKDFNEAVEKIPMEYLASINDSKEDYLNDLNKYYSKEDQEKYGVVAIEIEKYEKSCGTVVLKKEEDELKVLLVHHKKGHWGFPKGHVEDNETEKETALRETLEETGIMANIIGDFREAITYSPKVNTVKDVVYFIGEPKNNNIIPQLTEVSEAKFIEVKEAMELMIYDDEKNVLNNAISSYQVNI